MAVKTEKDVRAELAALSTKLEESRQRENGLAAELNEARLGLEQAQATETKALKAAEAAKLEADRFKGEAVSYGALLQDETTRAAGAEEAASAAQAEAERLGSLVAGGQRAHDALAAGAARDAATVAALDERITAAKRSLQEAVSSALDGLR